jgi:hypothetical protein
VQTESIHEPKEAEMLDLLAATDAVRQKTNDSFKEEVPKRGRRARRRRSQRAVRSTSAVALRRLADLIEPSRAGVVPSTTAPERR